MILTTGRTLNQAKGILSGKSSDLYLNEISTCEIDQQDLKELEINEGEIIEIISDNGSAITKVKKSRYEQKGIAFLAYGIVANMLINPNTDATGMPTLKNIAIKISKSDQKTYNDFLSKLRKEFQ